MSDSDIDNTASGAEGRGRPSRLSLFLRSSFFDFVLVLVVSVGLVFTVSYGFNSAADLRGNLVVASVACAVLLACLYVGAWSKRALPVAVGLYIVASVAVVAVVSSMSPESVDMFVDGQVNDVDANYAVYGIVVVVVPLVVYLLSRRTLGVAVLLLVGSLACGLIQFLYRDWLSTQPGIEAALAVYVGIGALFVVQGYRQGVLKAASVKRTSFFAAFAFGVIGAAFCVAAGVGLFYAVVDPMGIETINVKPFEDYYRRPTIEYNGGYAAQPVIDPDLGTSNLSDEESETNDPAYGMQDDFENESGGGFVFVSAITSALSPENWSEVFDASYFDIPPNLKILLALLPFLIIAAIVGARISVRNRRLKRLEMAPRAQGAIELYNFFMRGFKRLKIEKAASYTPLEFALSSANELAGFARNESKASFLDVTLIFQRAAYGAGNVSEEDWKVMKDYYKAFFTNAHNRMGTLKWALRGFWRI